MTAGKKHIFRIFVTGLISLTGTPLPAGFAQSLFPQAAPAQANTPCKL
jgi:hypothetical protein